MEKAVLLSDRATMSKNASYHQNNNRFSRRYIWQKVNE